MKKKAFTILEVVIVIIIISVLTSLALPRLFKMIKRSYAAEALTMFATARRAIEACYLMDGSYAPCCYSRDINCKLYMYPPVGLEYTDDIHSGLKFQYRYGYYEDGEGYYIIAKLYNRDSYPVLPSKDDEIVFHLRNPDTIDIQGKGIFEGMDF